MTREECERQILTLFEEIIDVAKQYDETLEYLTLVYNKDVISFNNDHWEGHNKIDLFRTEGTQ